MPLRDPVARTSDDPTANRLAQLRELFPDAFADGKLDFEKLKAVVGEAVPGGTERFQFTWAGRSDAVACLQTPTRATLLPCEEESVDFDTTKNLFLEGDNLEVLKLLYKPYHGRVKLIYIDPPYNTGQDFIYPDDFKDTLANYLKLTNQSDDAGNLLRSNPDTSGRYHSDWLSMMYPRLFLARQLLRDDGVIFLSIDDHEVHHLRMLMNEVFGEENFIAEIAVVNNLKGRNDREHIATTHEYILMYQREQFVSFGLPLSEKQLRDYKQSDEEGASFQWRDLRKRGGSDTRASRPNLYYAIWANPKDGSVCLTASDTHTVEIYPRKSDNSDGCWRWGSAKVAENLSSIRAAKTSGGKWNVNYRIYLEVEGEARVAKPKSTWTGPEYSTDAATKTYRNLLPGVEKFTPKPVGLLNSLLQISTEDDDIVLDFFSGSGTTAQAVLELNREDGGNRRFILVQLPEPTGNKKFPTIAEIGKERIRRVIVNIQKQPATFWGGGEHQNVREDLGFKVFKLAESHYANWSGVEDRTPEAYQKQLRIVIESPLRDGWTHEGLLWEIAVKEGYGLNSVITPVDGKSVTVYKVADPEKGQHFLACFAQQLPEDITKQLGLTIDDLFVVLDAALDDTLASNLALQCKLKTI